MNKVLGKEAIILPKAWPTLANKRQGSKHVLQGWDLNSRDTRDMKNNMEARTYAHTHIVLAKVQYEENRPAHLVLHTRDKQLKSVESLGVSRH